MKVFINIVRAIALILCILVLGGCSDEGGDDFPFGITAHDSTIDWGKGSEDGRSLISATMFDDEGTPLEDGNMIFTLNSSARGRLSDGEDLVTSVSVDLDDGVAEVWFVATPSPEVVIIKAYGPRFPDDAMVSTSVRVFNSSLVVNKAEFRSTVDDDDDRVYNFYDLSEYPEGTDTGTGNADGAITWNWTFTESVPDPVVVVPPNPPIVTTFLRSGSTLDDRDLRIRFDSDATSATASLTITIDGVTTDSWGVGISF